MATGIATSPALVVIDASFAIAICAMEPDKLANAEATLDDYNKNGCKFYAPGLIVMECLWVFCNKLTGGTLSSTEHATAVQALIKLMATIDPPPMGDKSLIQRAEEIRGSLGCSRSADGIYLALAEELSKIDTTEVVTFDSGMQLQAARSALSVSVTVVPTV